MNTVTSYKQKPRVSAAELMPQKRKVGLKSRFWLPKGVKVDTAVNFIRFDCNVQISKCPLKLVCFSKARAMSLLKIMYRTMTASGEKVCGHQSRHISSRGGFLNYNIGYPRI